jgi:hypothetical protein
MTPPIINKTFEALLSKGSEGRRKRKAIGMSSQACCYLRWRLKHYNDVMMSTKMNWLKKAGYDVGTAKGYTRAEMVSFARFCALPSNKKALALGYEYLMDKWEAVQDRKAFLKTKK